MGRRRRDRGGCLVAQNAADRLAYQRPSRARERLRHRHRHAPER